MKISMNKKILVIGANSYIGTYFKNWLQEKGNVIEVISSHNRAWAQKNFGLYDSIFYVAGIAHVDAKKSMKDIYYKVNRDLTLEVAKKARQDGVKQFIFMSSIIVYGENNAKNNNIIITKDTIPNPSGFYGDSKLQAEQGLTDLQDHSFKVAIVRPPMIYGKDSKGNYPRLARLATTIPIFPNVDNRKSMIYIENLCEFLRLIIENKEQGIFFPQNRDYVNTTELVNTIARIHGKRMNTSINGNLLVNSVGKYINIVNKVFGTMIYEKSMSTYRDFSYCIVDFEHSIKKTEK